MVGHWLVWPHLLAWQFCGAALLAQLAPVVAAAAYDASQHCCQPAHPPACPLPASPLIRPASPPAPHLSPPQLAELVGTACQRLTAANVPHNLFIADCGARVFLFPNCFAEKKARGLIPEGKGGAGACLACAAAVREACVGLCRSNNCASEQVI